MVPRFPKLGDHDHREVPGENEEEVVLVIRGELLKKYPNAVIYAQRAVLEGRRRRRDPRRLRRTASTRPRSATSARSREAEQEHPPRTVLKTPLYEAKVEPDITFFGFDLTVCEAKGGTGKASLPVDERCAAEGIPGTIPGGSS